MHRGDRWGFPKLFGNNGLFKRIWGAKLVVSRAARDVQARFLLRNGADEVVYPEKQLANWTAIRYSSEHIFDYIQLSDDHAIFEISIPENWVGKTVGNIDIRKKYNITIMALKTRWQAGNVHYSGYSTGQRCYYAGAGSKQGYPEVFSYLT